MLLYVSHYPVKGGREKQKKISAAGATREGQQERIGGHWIREKEKDRTREERQEEEERKGRSQNIYWGSLTQSSRSGPTPRLTPRVSER